MIFLRIVPAGFAGGATINEADDAVILDYVAKNYSQ
jgi:hypothetical protein